MNDFHGLEWTFTKPATSGIAFLDMSLSIKDCRIASTLYEKPLATYLYITPTSAHPPGVTASLVMGNVIRIMQICTDPADIGDKLEVFMEDFAAAVISTPHFFPSSRKQSPMLKSTSRRVKPISLLPSPLRPKQLEEPYIFTYPSCQTIQRRHSSSVVGETA